MPATEADHYWTRQIVRSAPRLTRDTGKDKQESSTSNPAVCSPSCYSLCLFVHITVNSNIPPHSGGLFAACASAAKEYLSTSQQMLCNSYSLLCVNANLQRKMSMGDKGRAKDEERDQEDEWQTERC